MIRDTIEVGFTHTDRAADYVPAMDGYRPGAAQTTVTIGPVNLPGQTEDTPITLEEAKSIAEACFVATNLPQPPSPGTLAHDIEQALSLEALAMATKHDPRLQHLRSLSVGDTVKVRGMTLAVARLGWEHVA